MNRITTTALVPIQNVNTLSLTVRSDTRSLERYNEFRDHVVYIAYPVDEPELIYGPDGRKKPSHVKKAEFIDSYI